MLKDRIARLGAWENRASTTSALVRQCFHIGCRGGSGGSSQTSQRGFGLCEISHRSDTFQAVVDSAMDEFAESYPCQMITRFFSYRGASLQFYMTALNLLKPGEQADFIGTGIWSKKAIAEANRVGQANNIWSDSENGFRSVPTDNEYTVLRTQSIFITSNNTLMGTQHHHLPDSGGKPIVVDASPNSGFQLMYRLMMSFMQGSEESRAFRSNLVILSLGLWLEQKKTQRQEEFQRC